MAAKACRAAGDMNSEVGHADIARISDCPGEMVEGAPNQPDA